VLAFLLHLVAGFLVFVGQLIMPLWAVLVLGGVWLGLLVLLVLKRGSSRWAFAIPLASVILWFAAAFAGEALLDWTA
jgi:hypothetical protein